MPTRKLNNTVLELFRFRGYSARQPVQIIEQGDISFREPTQQPLLDTSNTGKIRAMFKKKKKKEVNGPGGRN